MIIHTIHVLLYIYVLNRKTGLQYTILVYNKRMNYKYILFKLQDLNNNLLPLVFPVIYDILFWQIQLLVPILITKCNFITQNCFVHKKQSVSKLGIKNSIVCRHFQDASSTLYLMLLVLRTNHHTVSKPLPLCYLPPI